MSAKRGSRLELRVLMKAIRRLGVTQRGTGLSASVRIFGGAARAAPATTPTIIAAIAMRASMKLADGTRPFAVNGVTMALYVLTEDGWRRVGRRLSRTDDGRGLAAAPARLSPRGRA